MAGVAAAATTEALNSAVAAAPAPSCGGDQPCPHWRAPKELPPAAAQYIQTAVGNCHRFPQSVIKKPEDVCGEHPELVMLRTTAAVLHHQVAAGTAAAQPPTTVPPAPPPLPPQTRFGRSRR